MKKQLFLAGILLVAVVTAGIYLYLTYRRSGPRIARTFEFFNNPASVADVRIAAGTRCGSAPFIFATDGFVGFIWDDKFSLRHRHQGLDIFAGTDIGVTPVIAAYPGYLTRRADWKSTVIVRVPSDPLNPGAQIWVYYTHMADEQGNSFISSEFPAGTSERLIEAGVLLGYQGDYSGDPGSPTGVHLHISIVKDDGNGNYLNELDINNTYDPSPYFGMPMNALKNRDVVPTCSQDGAS